MTQVPHPTADSSRHTMANDAVRPTADVTVRPTADVNVRPTADVTVVIPVYNRADLIGRTVSSIAAQTVWPAHLVLVDNASTDNTPDVLHSLQKALSDSGMHVTVTTETTPGATAARNRGLELVNTAWVMFFDSDDEMLPTHIATAIGTADANPGASIIGWDTATKSDGHVVRTQRFEVRGLAAHNILHGTLATQRYMARTELVISAGRWNTSIPIWNDIELGTRLLKAGGVAVRRDDSAPLVIIHRTGDLSITGSRFSDRASRYPAALRAMAATLGDGATNLLALKAMILAADMSREGSAEGRRWRRGINSAVHGLWSRTVLNAAYLYRRVGMRGGARLMAPLLPKS